MLRSAASAFPIKQRKENILVRLLQKYRFIFFACESKPCKISLGSKPAVTASIYDAEGCWLFAGAVLTSTPCQSRAKSHKRAAVTRGTGISARDVSWCCTALLRSISLLLTLPRCWAGLCIPSWCAPADGVPLPAQPLALVLCSYHMHKGQEQLPSSSNLFASSGNLRLIVFVYNDSFLVIFSVD